MDKLKLVGLLTFAGGFLFFFRPFHTFLGSLGLGTSEFWLSNWVKVAICLHILGGVILAYASWRKGGLGRPSIPRWLKPIGLALLVVGAVALATGLYTYSTADEVAYSPHQANIINKGTVDFWEKLGIIDMYAHRFFEARRAGLASILLGVILMLPGGVAIGKIPWKLALILAIILVLYALVLWMHLRT